MIFTWSLLFLHILSSVTSVALPLNPFVYQRLSNLEAVTMATERLNSILSHLTPSKSGVSAMYAASPAFNLHLLIQGQQNPEEL